MTTHNRQFKKFPMDIEEDPKECILYKTFLMVHKINSSTIHSHMIQLKQELSSDRNRFENNLKKIKSDMEEKKKINKFKQNMRLMYGLYDIYQSLINIMDYKSIKEEEYFKTIVFIQDKKHQERLECKKIEREIIEKQILYKSITNKLDIIKQENKLSPYPPSYLPLVPPPTPSPTPSYQNVFFNTEHALCDMQLENYCIYGINCMYKNYPLICSQNHINLGTVIQIGNIIPSTFCRYERPWIFKNGKSLRCTNIKCCYAHLKGHFDEIKIISNI